MNRLSNIITNPFILALIITVITFVFTNSLFDKYKVELVKHKVIAGEQLYYHDLDHDKYSESIELGYNYEGENFPYIKCKTAISLSGSKQLIGQFNLKRKWMPEIDVFFGDYDNNGKDEIYVFGYQEDSLFLTGIDPFKSNNILFDQFICIVPFKDKVPDFGIYIAGLYDLDADLHKELVFEIIAGFGLIPRSLLAYNIHSDSLIQGSHLYAKLSYPAAAYDKNRGYVFASHSYAPENYGNPPEGYYSDSSSWLFVFNKHLEPFFPPVENSLRKSTIMAAPRAEDSIVYVYALFRGQDYTKECELVKYDLSGNEVARKTLENRHDLIILRENKNRLLVLNSLDHSMMEIYPDLSMDIVKKKFGFSRLYKEIDIDRDGKYEVVSRHHELMQLNIYRAGFTHPVVIDFPYSTNYFFITDVYFKDESAQLYIQNNDHIFYYKYYINPFYCMKWLLYVALFFIISLFLYLILGIQRRSLQKKHEQERKVMELELMTIKSQMDPHFTFNAINSISSVMYNEDRKKAYSYMVDFANLIRSLLINSKNISIPLNEEIDFVTNYLNLQQLRHNNRFEYGIEIDKDVNMDTIIPKMIIQTFAENAIKHGLAHLHEKGQLNIRIFKDNSHVIINIEDNGVGREKAKELSKRSTGKGMEIIDQTLDLYKKLQKTAVTYQVKDLYTEDRATGTSVTIKIPIDKH